MRTLFLLSLILAAGCASNPSKAVLGDPPPKLSRVQVLLYDTSPRPPTAKLDVYEREQPSRPYKVIALLTCEGAVDQEVVMTKAIFYRAREIGAEGVMTADAQSVKEPGSMVLGTTGGTRCIFKARAVIYQDK